MLSKLQTLKEEREQGFTLIELLVVILIIGILSAIAIPAFMNQRKSAVDSSVQADLSNATKQIETFVVKSGSTAKNLDAAGSGIKDIKVSDGTTLTITGTTFDYEIKATNPGGDIADSASTEGGFYYESTKGGIVKKANYAAQTVGKVTATTAGVTVTP